LGWSEPAPIAVWMETRRVWLAPEGNILLRCGLDSSVKIWRTEPLQPGWLTSASPVALSGFSVRCARDSLFTLGDSPSLPFLSLSPSLPHPCRRSSSPSLAGDRIQAPPAEGPRRASGAATAAASSGPSTRAAAAGGPSGPSARAAATRRGGAHGRGTVASGSRSGGEPAGRRDNARPPRLLRRTSLLPPRRVP